MALGLNIVVGFAGLLDLGYVAFFAIGAFVMGWLMSAHFPDSETSTSSSPSRRQQLPGIHINFFFVIFIAAAFTALWGAILGAPTLRLRGDYLAIVTLAFGEIVPRVFELATSGPFGIGNLDFSNGRQGITPIDKPYFPVPGLDEITRIELKPIYFVALGDGAARPVPQLPPARLAARARLDRRARGRGRRGGDGRQPRARRSSGPTRSAPRSAASPACSWARTRTPSTSTSSSSASRCSSSAWSSSAAWATSGA